MTLPHLERKGLPRVFWIYLAAAGLVAAGYTDFPLIAFHFKKSSITTDQWIPVLYAVAMGVDAAAALLFGKLFDRMGLSVLVIATAISAFFAPFVFLGDIRIAIVGMTLWGIGMGAQESIMRAAVGAMVSADRRASAYGLFNAIYGAAWFAGSALMGFLYDVSIPFVIAFSVGAQLIALIILLRIPKK
jgi:predicted MFS family arabinose efflux permease